MRTRIAIASVLYLVAAVTLVVTVAMPFRHPEPFRFRLSLPKTAEVLPAKRVHPGTFKLEYSWDEFSERARQSASRAIVSFGGGNRDSDGNLIGMIAKTKVEAYLSRGDSTFDYAQITHEPDFPYGFLVGRVERYGNSFMAYPQLAWHPLLISGLLAVILGLIGAIVHPWSTRKTVYPLST